MKLRLCSPIRAAPAIVLPLSPSPSYLPPLNRNSERLSHRMAHFSARLLHTSLAALLLLLAAVLAPLRLVAQPQPVSVIVRLKPGVDAKQAREAIAAASGAVSMKSVVAGGSSGPL